ncbi:MAG TPA: hypothetical protein VH092_07220 [Urbifossiella sp.]|nr:hypothetical protein [Urbifossiella sp.]
MVHTRTAVATQQRKNLPTNSRTVCPSATPASRGSRRPATASNPHNTYPTPDSPIPGPARAYWAADEPAARKAYRAADAGPPYTASARHPSRHTGAERRTGKEDTL